MCAVSNAWKFRTDPWESRITIAYVYWARLGREYWHFVSVENQMSVLTGYFNDI
jgi:hypothetical protein